MMGMATHSASAASSCSVTCQLHQPSSYHILSAVMAPAAAADCTLATAGCAAAAATARVKNHTAAATAAFAQAKAGHAALLHSAQAACLSTAVARDLLAAA